MQTRWLKLLSGVVLSVLILSACGAGSDQDNGTDTEEGAPPDGNGAAAYDEAAAREAYQTGTCASCHGGNLEGSVGPSLEEVGQKYSADEIVEIINNGIGEMPPAGDNLDDDAKQNLAAWLADHQ